MDKTKISKEGAVEHVLWFSPVLLPEMLRFLDLPPSVRAGWIPSLLHALRKCVPQVRFSVVALAAIKKELHFEQDGVGYYLLPWRLPTRWARKRVLNRAKQLIGETGAELVHIHGSETFFSKLAYADDIRVPVCVSIQGLLSKCRPYQYAGLSWCEKTVWQFRVRELVLRQGPLFGWLSWHKKAKDEVRLLRRGIYFIGRTIWDRANVLAQNPDAWYGHGDELVRKVFYQPPKRTTSSRRPVLVLGRASPIKGVTVFLKTLDILKRRGLSFDARVFGRFDPNDGLGRILLRRIRALGLEDNIKFIGSQTEEGVAKELAGASVFVHPSFMDNSPNSICEAMLMETPVIATHCGGVASLIRHGETGILVPPGDAEVLADAIITILSTPENTQRMVEQAKLVAKFRHDETRVAKSYAETYDAICRHFAQMRSCNG